MLVVNDFELKSVVPFVAREEGEHQRRFNCLAAYSKGLLVGYNEGVLRIYDDVKQESEGFKLVYEFTIRQDPSDITSICVSPF